MKKIYYIFLISLALRPTICFAFDNPSQEDPDLKLKRDFYQKKVQETQEKIKIFSQKLKNYEECVQDPQKEFQLKNGTLLLRSERHIEIIKENIIYSLTKRKHKRTKSTDISEPLLPQLSKTLFLETLWKSFNKMTGNILPYVMTRKREIIQNSFVQSLSQIYDVLYIDNHPNIGPTFEDAFHRDCLLNPNLFYTYGANPNEGIFYQKKETPGINNNCLLYSIFSKNLLLLEKLKDIYLKTFLKDQKKEITHPLSTDEKLPETAKEETQNEKELAVVNGGTSKTEPSGHDINLENLEKIIDLSKIHGLENPQLCDLTPLRLCIFNLIQHHAFRKIILGQNENEKSLYIYQMFDIQNSALTKELEEIVEKLEKEPQENFTPPKEILKKFFDYLTLDINNQMNAQLAMGLSFILDYPMHILFIRSQNPKRLEYAYKHSDNSNDPILILQEGNGLGGHFSRLEKVEKKDNEASTK